MGIIDGWWGISWSQTSNHTVTGNLFYINDCGMKIFRTKNNEISNNIFYGNGRYRDGGEGSINIIHSDSNKIYRNHISFGGCIDGGILIISSNSNLVSENYISDCNRGIVMVGFDSNHQSSKNEIYGNFISENPDGGIVLVDRSNRNIISYNYITNNSLFGLTIQGRANFNYIHHNNFINCTINAVFVNCLYNKWYHNYWNRPRFLPKPVFGIIRLIPWINFDRRPARTPNEIPIPWFEFDWHLPKTPYGIVSN